VRARPREEANSFDGEADVDLSHIVKHLLEEVSILLLNQVNDLWTVRRETEREKRHEGES
jgi:hypothetical protein